MLLWLCCLIFLFSGGALFCHLSFPFLYALYYSGPLDVGLFQTRDWFHFHLGESSLVAFAFSQILLSAVSITFIQVLFYTVWEQALGFSEGYGPFLFKDDFLIVRNLRRNFYMHGQFSRLQSRCFPDFSGSGSFSLSVIFSSFLAFSSHCYQCCWCTFLEMLPSRHYWLQVQGCLAHSVWGPALIFSLHLLLSRAAG